MKCNGSGYKTATELALGTVYLRVGCYSSSSLISWPEHMLIAEEY